MNRQVRRCRRRLVPLHLLPFSFLEKFPRRLVKYINYISLVSLQMGRECVPFSACLVRPSTLKWPLAVTATSGLHPTEDGQGWLSGGGHIDSLLICTATRLASFVLRPSTIIKHSMDSSFFFSLYLITNNEQWPTL